MSKLGRPRRPDLDAYCEAHPGVLRATAASRLKKALYVEPAVPNAGTVNLSITDGVVLIGSDCHYWPGDPSTAHRAFVHMCTALSPAAVVLNGDVFDGARISRFPQSHWQEYLALPGVQDEIGVCQARLREILDAACGSASPPEEIDFVWTLGNHDSRFERYLIAGAAELAGFPGTRLKDHFPDWTPAMDVWINRDGPEMVSVKHRFKSGIHAPHNNTKDAGVTMVTGHLHSLKVMPWSDYRGTRWGVDGGMMGVPYSDPFYAYTEHSPVNWRSGFVVLTFRGGRLMWPELVWVMDEAAGLVCFRGEVLEV